MAIEPLDDPVTRAVRVARRDDPGWPDVSRSVLSRLHALVPHGQPVLIEPAAGSVDDGSRTQLSTRVLLAVLRDTLTSSPTHAPTTIDFTVDDDRLTGVHIGLVAAYGVRLHPLADRVRADVMAALRLQIGPNLDSTQVTITISDVVAGDPTTT